MFVSARDARLTRGARGRTLSEGDASRGFTLIELVAVILLLVVMSTLVAARFETLTPYRNRTQLRKFLDLWESLAQESVLKGESYRLVVDFDSQTYYVRREIPVTERAPRTVDYLAGWKAKAGSKSRDRNDERLPDLKEEYADEASREGEGLESIFFRTFFRDPEDLSRLGIPLAFPSLAEAQPLPSGLHFRDVVIGSTTTQRGKAYIRFASNGATDFAVMHLLLEGKPMTAVMNPGAGTVQLHNGDLNFEFSLAKSKK